MSVFLSTVPLLFLSLAVELAGKISFKPLSAEKKTILKQTTGMCVGGNGRQFFRPGDSPRLLSERQWKTVATTNNNVIVHRAMFHCGHRRMPIRKSSPNPD